MKADATGFFVTAFANALQLVGMFTFPDANDVPFCMAVKNSLGAMLGKFTLSSWLNVSQNTCGLLTSSMAIVRNSN